MSVINTEKNMERLTHKLDRLKSLEANTSLPIPEWEGRFVKYPAPQEYRKPGPWKKIRTGTCWKKEATLFLRKKIEIPAQLEPGKTFLDIKFKYGEALVSINGNVCGAVDRQHSMVQIPAKYIGNDEVLIEMELWLNKNVSERSGDGGIITFQSAEIIQLNRAVWKYVIHIKTFLDLLKYLQAENRELTEKLLSIAHCSMNIVKLQETGRKLENSVRKADRYLENALSKLNIPTKGELSLVGSTHIDVAWLWQHKETVRKCSRTFTNMFSLMEDYPDFIFSFSQPQLFEFTKKYYPEIYRKIQKYVKQDRLEPIGVMWVESDTNIPSGESLIRQILFGHKFYSQEFGTYTPVAWLPDVFGYSPNLPQIFKKAGIKYFLGCKVYWQTKNVFPYRLFWWEGIDGTRILATTPYTSAMYSGDPNPRIYRFTWENFTEKEKYNNALIPYGFGDGGGGPTPEQVERAVFLRKIPGLPESRFSTVSDYFRDVEKKAKDLPVWSGEIYIETHRGTLTSQAWIKKANRRAEQLFRQAEIFSSLCHIADKRIDTKKLNEGWKLILLNQFHDVLPGPSIPEVYTDARKQYEKINRYGGDILEKSLSTLIKEHSLSDTGKGFCIFNPNSWSRSDIEEIDCLSRNIKGIKTIEGKCIPVQMTKDKKGKRKVLFEVENIPPFGFQYYEVTDKETELPQNELKVTTKLMENKFVRIDLTSDGLIRQITSKISGNKFIET